MQLCIFIIKINVELTMRDIIHDRALPWHIPLADLRPLLCVAPRWEMSALANSDTLSTPSPDMCSVLTAGVVGRKQNSLPSLPFVSYLIFYSSASRVRFTSCIQPGFESVGGVDRWLLSHDRARCVSCVVTLVMCDNVARDCLSHSYCNAIL